MDDSWYIYIVRCADDTLYTGVAKDVEKRINEHNHSKLGARYTRARRPVTLVHVEQASNRSEACRREAAIKKLARQKKEQLLNSQS